MVLSKSLESCFYISLNSYKCEYIWSPIQIPNSQNNASIFNIFKEGNFYNSENS